VVAIVSRYDSKAIGIAEGVIVDQLFLKSLGEVCECGTPAYNLDIREEFFSVLGLAFLERLVY
jgi:hypothetical protein